MTGVFCVAEACEEIVGVLAGYVHQAGDRLVEAAFDRSAYISDLFVRSAWRRQGVGAALVRAFEETMRAKGLQWMSVCVKSRNAIAHQAYSERMASRTTKRSSRSDFCSRRRLGSAGGAASGPNRATRLARYWRSVASLPCSRRPRSPAGSNGLDDRVVRALEVLVDVVAASSSSTSRWQTRSAVFSFSRGLSPRVKARTLSSSTSVATICMRCSVRSWLQGIDARIAFSEIGKESLPPAGAHTDIGHLPGRAGVSAAHRANSAPGRVIPPWPGARPIGARARAQDSARRRPRVTCDSGPAAGGCWPDWCRAWPCG